jgi:hypothetical protein
MAGLSSSAWRLPHCARFFAERLILTQGKYLLCLVEPWQSAKPIFVVHFFLCRVHFFDFVVHYFFVECNLVGIGQC